MVEVLLAAGADPNHFGNDCSTALEAACSANYHSIIRRLLAAGADVRSAVNGRSALHIAAGGHDVEAVRALLAAPTGREAAASTDDYGRGVMHEWAERAWFVASHPLNGTAAADMAAAVACARALREAGAVVDAPSQGESFNFARSRYEAGGLPLAELRRMAEEQGGADAGHVGARVAAAARELLAAAEAPATVTADGVERLAGAKRRLSGATGTSGGGEGGGNEPAGGPAKQPRT